MLDATTSTTFPRLAFDYCPEQLPWCTVCQQDIDGTVLHDGRMQTAHVTIDITCAQESGEPVPPATYHVQIPASELTAAEARNVARAIESAVALGGLR